MRKGEDVTGIVINDNPVGVYTDIHALQEQIEVYRKALREIRDNQGKVCEIYADCQHPAYDSSYACWATANEILTRFGG